MKQSDDSSASAEATRRPEPRQQQPPAYPYVLALTRTAAFGMQPIHFRAGTVEKFEAEFCPHLGRWRWLESAQQDEPPCTFRLANHDLPGCPTNQEAECSIYVMARCAGRSIERARQAKALPFNPDPQPDGDPQRELPRWVTDHEEGSNR